MITTNLGLFDGFLRMTRALYILEGCGFSRDEISIITRESEVNETFDERAPRLYETGRERRRILQADLGNLVIFVKSLFVGGAGRVAVAGPLALMLPGTASEAKPGDLIAALMDLNVSDEVADAHAEGVRRGGTLLTVSAASHLAERAEDVMLLHGAVDIRQRALRWRQQGWHNFRPAAELYTAQEMARERLWQAEERKPGKEWNPYDRDFRGHFYGTYSDGDLPYEHYAFAYRYGYQLARDERYDKKNWCEIETQVQQAWERQHETGWITVADAISYGFLTGRANYPYRFRS
jgi:hypothetical protein